MSRKSVTVMSAHGSYCLCWFVVQFLVWYPELSLSSRFVWAFISVAVSYHRVSLCYPPSWCMSYWKSPLDGSVVQTFIDQNRNVLCTWSSQCVNKVQQSEMMNEADFSDQLSLSLKLCKSWLRIDSLVFSIHSCTGVRSQWFEPSHCMFFLL